MSERHHLEARGFTLGQQDKRPRRPPLKDAINAARSAGLTIRSARITKGEVVLEFDGARPAGGDDWDKAIEKAISKRED